MKAKGNTASKIILHIILILLALCCIVPIFLMISVSVSDINDIYENGYRFFPRNISFDAYKYIFSNSSQLLNAYKNSILIVVMGGVLSVLFTSMLAYPMSKPDFKYKKGFSFYVFFTMLFNGGMVPLYILIVNYLHLKNTLAVLVLPYLVNAWYIMMMRTFFKSLPGEVMEAAEIDGCGEFRTFFTIVLPMSKPAIATIGLLTVLRYWNDWWLALMYIEKDHLIPLQYLLYRLISNLEELNRQAAEMGTMTELSDFPSEAVRMAMAAVASVPILIVFPFFQKYFTKGLTVGAVKG